MVHGDGQAQTERQNALHRSNLGAGQGPQPCSVGADGASPIDDDRRRMTEAPADGDLTDEPHLPGAREPQGPEEQDRRHEPKRGEGEPSDTTSPAPSEAHGGEGADDRVQHLEHRLKAVLLKLFHQLPSRVVLTQSRV